ncbi:hypothetical protein EV183_000293 [Coemansia sp. RSA 2336]|nr:hypothetical protein EV183_000293 [Coemansia sp. RSA 2336]
MARTCYYELLGVERSASDAELKKAYRRQALVWHPDKNHGNVEEATQVFAEIKEAYETLSDPQERAWYDNHREQILRGDDYVQPDAYAQPDMSANVSFMSTDALMRFFSVTSFRGFDDSPSGFFAVYRDLFTTLRDEELQAPGSPAEDDMLLNLDFGNAHTLYDDDEPGRRGRSAGTGATLRDFYNFWTTFGTRKSFGWFDRYRLADAENRQIRRLMEKENRHLREKARREFVETVQNLAAWVRKRDPRYKSYVDHKQRQQKLREEERRRCIAEQRAAVVEDASEYVRQEWEEVDYTNILDEHLGQSDEGGAVPEAAVEPNEEPAVDSPSTGEDLDCAICNKSFKSAAQKANHEKSNKHQKAVRDVRRQMLREEREMARMQKQQQQQQNEVVGLEPVPLQSSDSDDALEQMIQELTLAQATAGKRSKRKKKQQKAAIGIDVEPEPKPEAKAKTRSEPKPEPEAMLEAELAMNETATEQPRRPTKRELRREREKAKTRNELACNVCKEEFASRNQLFKHIQETGHALAAKSKGSRSKR